jgi:hypothetical protein
VAPVMGTSISTGDTSFQRARPPVSLHCHVE